MMNFARKAALGLAVFMGALVGADSTAYSQETNQQCYRRPGFDPPDACSVCGDTCLGAGYRCCRIVIITN
jgi:hypothetical protein